MVHTLVVLALGIGVVFVAQRLWQRLRTAQLGARRQLATLEFASLREPLQAEFLQAAAATGKPRGLSWKQCDLDDVQLFATDRVSGELYALVRATIRFEAIAGGDMEEVEAVDNLRCATAIFVYRDGSWTTDGRAAFNLEPPQALQRFQESLQPLG